MAILARVCQRIEVAGFSSPPTNPRDLASSSSVAARSLIRFDRATLRKSLPTSSFNPLGHSLLRNGPGKALCGGARLAREKVSHGVPASTPQTRPAEIHPFNSP
eukprot:5919664-Heterocapsa_arctica.AAC.1